MKIKLFIFAVLNIALNYVCYSQEGNFSNITFNTLTKGAGYNQYSGWGVSTDNALDTRPYSPNGGAFYMNHHYGLTFSAHSYYGGIRFYNQAYPGSPYDSSNGASMVMSINQGNVGIGDAFPQSMLTLKRMVAGGDQISIYKTDNTPNLDVVSTYNGSLNDHSGSFAYGVRPLDDSWQIWEKGTNTSWVNLLTIKKNGNIGIGTELPLEKLAVNGKIRAQEIKVEASPWPDYVFTKSYPLPTLQETEKHIKEKGHLPGIPSAQEVKANGIDLGEMNAKLLQKIEELTLHLIEKDSELNLQKDRLDQQQLQLLKQQEQINSIIKKLK